MMPSTDDLETSSVTSGTSGTSGTTLGSQYSVAKTPVSLLQELFVKRGITPKYDLVQIEGAVHEPTFKYRVTVGDFVATGSGQSKKKAKHIAAKTVLEKIRYAQQKYNKSLGSTTSSDGIAASNLTSEVNIDVLASPYDDGIEGNPVGELQELCMNRRMAPPTYEVAMEEGQPHERKFVLVCTAGNQSIAGIGKSKKLAKRQAAWKLLEELKAQPSPNAPDLMTQNNLDEDDLAQGITHLLKSRQKHSIFYKNLKDFEGSKLKNLQSDTDLSENSVKKLEEIADEQHFSVTFVPLEEKSQRGLNNCLVQISTSPVAVCFGSAKGENEAKIEAAINALEYLKIMTK